MLLLSMRHRDRRAVPPIRAANRPAATPLSRPSRVHDPAAAGRAPGMRQPLRALQESIQGTFS